MQKSCLHFPHLPVARAVDTQYKTKKETLRSLFLWCHQEMSSIRKWIYIFAVTAKINYTSA